MPQIYRDAMRTMSCVLIKDRLTKIRRPFFVSTQLHGSSRLFLNGKKGDFIFAGKFSFLPMRG